MLSFEEARVVGAMVEKAMTTPDNYPMSLNAVVTACNQVSNRDPVVTVEEGVVELTLRGLADRGLAKMVHRPGDRVVKYRHALDAELELDDRELALVAVLLLRGAQTPGELRQHTQRYVAFASLPDVEAALEALRHRDRPLVARLTRQPGQKEHRYRHLLVHDGPADAASEDPFEVEESAAALSDAPDSGPTFDEDAAELQSELTALRAEVAALSGRLERIEREFGID